jgi:hypothetical protein
VKKKYTDELKDPRWQKVRLAVFERDDWRCHWCGSKSLSLNVHHIIYTKKHPWSENKDNLETVCEKCHKKLHDKKLNYVPGQTFGSEGFMAEEKKCPRHGDGGSCISGSGSSLCCGYYGSTVNDKFTRCTWVNGGLDAMDT